MGSVMTSGKPHKFQDQRNRSCPVVWWLGPDILHHASNCANGHPCVSDEWALNTTFAAVVRTAMVATADG